MLPTLLATCGPHPGAPAAEAPGDGFHFAVLGDRTDEANDAAWRGVLADVEARRPDLVLTVGDLVLDPFSPAEWDRVLAGVALLGRPIAFTPGNHDILDEASAAIFSERTGQAPYRSFDQGGLHFVVVDNSNAERWEELPEEQRRWLEGDLAASAGRPTVVLMHKPFWALGVAAGKPDPMHALFLRSGVVAVFTGHWHSHLHARIDGIAYTGVGTSGGVSPGLPHPRRGNAPEHVEARWQDGALTLRTIVAGQQYPVDLGVTATRPRCAGSTWARCAAGSSRRPRGHGSRCTSRTSRRRP